MRLGLSQNLRIEQRQIQSPQMIQAMQVLQYPLLELQDRIDTELQENVFLDVVEPERQQEDSKQESELPDDLEASFQTLEQLDERQRELGRLRTRGSVEDADAKQEALNNTPGRHESLADHLVGQLSLLELDPELRERVEIVIYSLNADGRLVSSVEEDGRVIPAAEELAVEIECSVEDIEEALLIVQGLDPSRRWRPEPRRVPAAAARPHPEQPTASPHDRREAPRESQHEPPPRRSRDRQEPESRT
jgi:RNA polymerase sigma-54 factor